MAKYTHSPNGMDVGASGVGGLKTDTIVPKTTSTNTVTVTATGFQVSGLLYKRASFGMISASKTLTQAQDGTTFRVYTSGKTATLPATHAAGTEYTFVTTSTANAGTFWIKPGSTTACTLYTHVGSTLGQSLKAAVISAGQNITLRSNGTHWFSLGYGGTWSKVNTGG